MGSLNYVLNDLTYALNGFASHSRRLCAQVYWGTAKKKPTDTNIDIIDCMLTERLLTMACKDLKLWCERGFKRKLPKHQYAALFFSFIFVSISLMCCGTTRLWRDKTRDESPFDFHLFHVIQIFDKICQNMLGESLPSISLEQWLGFTDEIFKNINTHQEIADTQIERHD